MASRKSKSEIEREKIIQNRLQELLTRMLQDEDNKYCVDCDAKGIDFNFFKCPCYLLCYKNGFFRTKMGIVEFRHFRLHSMRWNS